MRRRDKNTGPYRSKFEGKVAKSLEAMGIRVLYETESFPYEQPVRKYHCASCGARAIVKERSYTPDFILPNGDWIEVKGRFTGADRVKMLAIQEFYPDQRICLLFQRDNHLSAKKITRYSEWAKKHGFPFAISESGHVPESWVE